MSRPHQHARRSRRLVTWVLSLIALSAMALTGLALAKSFTLKARKHVKVTNVQTSKSKKETIVVNSHGVSLYYLAGETTSNPLCTKANGCFSFWPPLQAPSGKLSRGPGVPKGKLGKWNRGGGVVQVTYKGHPLYAFSLDSKKPGVAGGDHIVSFGGTWHVIPAK